MILNSHDHRGALRGRLKDSLAERLAELSAETGEPGYRITAVVAAVSAAPVAALDVRLPGENALGYLVGRALWQTGSRTLARRYLETYCATASDRLLPLVAVRRPVRPDDSKTAGRMRRMELHGAAPGSAWRLDLDRLTAAGGPFLELDFWPRLRCAVELLAGVWDETGGAGSLLLAGSNSPGGRRGRARGSAKNRMRTAARLFCNRILRRHGESAGWQRQPRVLWTLS